MMSEIIVAIDISGSVQHFKQYWNVVKQVVHNYRSRYSTNVKYIFWDHQALFVSSSFVDQSIQKEIGQGGTQPHIILECIYNKYDDKHSIELCIITDGDVEQESVNMCDKIIDVRTYNLKRVECHIINSYPNLSVSCPFTRNGECKVVTYNTSNCISNNIQGIVQLHLTNEDWTILHTIETITLNTFLEHF